MKSEFHPQAEVVSVWLKYKRYVDNVIVKGRIVRIEGKDYIESIRDDLQQTLQCPRCRWIITELAHDLLGACYHAPEVFHELHKPYET
jgi:hypothetical protein